jgi:phosphoribosyl 1,2-cyclic phosphate phosphodiesterase
VKLTFLGTGTSFGVPQIGCDCAVCRSDDPRDKRTRVGAVIEHGGVRLLIDAPPELRLQLIANGIAEVDAVLFTHDHADHTHGIDDIRAISLRRVGALPMYGPRETIDLLRDRFGYIFDQQMRVIPGTSKPEGSLTAVEPGVPFTVAGLDVLAMEVPHGRARVFGYRVGPIGYVTDAKSLPETAIAALRGVEVLVLNALFRTEHPTHLSLGEAVETARRIGASRTYFTHLTHQNAHAVLEAEFPDGIHPAFDGLQVTVAE